MQFLRCLITSEAVFFNRSLIAPKVILNVNVRCLITKPMKRENESLPPFDKLNGSFRYGIFNFIELL